MLNDDELSEVSDLAREQTRASLITLIRQGQLEFAPKIIRGTVNYMINR